MLKRYIFTCFSRTYFQTHFDVLHNDQSYFYVGVLSNNVYFLPIILILTIQRSFYPKKKYVLCLKKNVNAVVT